MLPPLEQIEEQLPERSIFSHTHIPHVWMQITCWEVKGSRREMAAWYSKGKVFKLVVSHNMDAEWSWYLLIVTEKDCSPDQDSLSIMLHILRDRSTGRAWHVNKQHRQSQKKKSLKEAALQGQHSHASIFKSHQALFLFWIQVGLWLLPNVTELLSSESFSDFLLKNYFQICFLVSENSGIGKTGFLIHFYYLYSTWTSGNV